MVEMNPTTDEAARRRLQQNLPGTSGWLLLWQVIHPDARVMCRGRLLPNYYTTGP